MKQEKQMSFIGFETWHNKIRMVIKMQLYIMALLMFCQLALLVFIFFKKVSPNEMSVIFAYIKSFIPIINQGSTSLSLGGNSYNITFSALQASYAPYVQQIIVKFLKVGSWSLLIYLLWFPITYMFYKRARNQTDSSFLRGAVLVEPKKLMNLMQQEKTYLPIGQVRMPISAEVKHTLIIGRPGVGKTVGISHMLEKIIARGDRAIIHDFKGDYLQKFYRPDVDIIFNPLDARSHYWNFFDEIDSPVDVDAVGYALIPDAKGQGMDPFWNNAARDVFTGVVNHLIHSGSTDYKSLNAILISPSDIIGDSLKYTPGSEAGATAIADPQSKQTGSILSVLTQYTKIFAYMKDDKNAKSFTINKWLTDKTAGNIYITNYSTLQDTLAPIITLMIDLMGRKLLSLPDDPKRRLFFMLDEFGALQKMQTITRLLTLARSKGGGVFLGIQDLGQIDKTYGKEHRQTIVNACGSSIVFAIADSDTAETLSKKYGEYLAIESYVTQSMGVQSNRDGISINQQKSRERIVMPSEINSLPDLNCYVQFPGYPVAKTKLTYKHYKDFNEPFVERSGLSYKEILKRSDTKTKIDDKFVEFEFEKAERTTTLEYEMEPLTNMQRINDIENEDNNG